MADIELYEDDSEDTIESDTAVGFEDYDSDPCDPDAGLSMLQRLEKYCRDENMYTRQMVTRSLLETIRTIEYEVEAQVLLHSIVTLADDPEAMVRSELMEHIPHVAIYCLENMHIFGDPLPTHLLPIVVKYITDNNNQVRKTSQAALLVLLEQDMIKRDDVEIQVCPVILELSHPDSMDDFRTEAVALMSKLAPMVGKEATEHIFLDRFAEMCTDPLFHVRKVCATNFGDFCQVVGQDHTEHLLLPKFYYLCEDGVWGVRKACAECFMQVSCVSSLKTRRTDLAQVFVNLICDQSRWVRMAAFQALGSFISTFADPSNTGLYFSEEGLLMVGNPEEFHISKSEDGPHTEDSSDKSNCDTITHSGTHPQTSHSVDNEVQKQQTTKSLVDKSNQENTSASSALKSDSNQVVSMNTDNSSIDTVNEAIQHLNLDLSIEEIRAKLKDNDSSPAESPDYSTDVGTSSNLSDDDTDTQADEDSDNVFISSGATDHSSYPSSRQFSMNKYFLPGDLSFERTVVLSSPSTSPLHTLDGKHMRTNPNKVHIHMDNNNTAFNTFQFWRMPVPEINVEVDIVNGKAANIHVKTKVKDTDTSTALVSEFDVKVYEESLSETNENSRLITSTESSTQPMEIDPSSSISPSKDMDNSESSDNNNTEKAVRIHTASVSTVSETVEEVANFGTTHILGHHVNESTLSLTEGVVRGGRTGDESPGGPANTSEEQDSIDESSLPNDQDVIPQPLLDHYLSMIDPSRAQTVDSEIAKHCAYSLPAVAYTLGRKYWPCLKDLYETLAGDMQWKVRRTLAFSIHELAVIVGQDITTRDLVPVFNGFLKDLDEVRIGVLKHLGDFLRLLKPDGRQEYLSKIYEFLNTDNTRNWRFREELAIQLRFLLELYTPADISMHLVPVAFTLAEDQVAAVRTYSFSVLSCMIGQMAKCNDASLLTSLVADIKDRFACSDQWGRRQMYIHVCTSVLEESVLLQEQFATHLLPTMLSLAKDPTPNVRIALSRTLSRYIMNSDYFTSGQNPLHAELLETIQFLKLDSDRDVRHFLCPMLEVTTNLGTDTIPV